jgi:ABC-type polysaccharide/polyol phosphate transport system ATPase subunit
MPIIEINHVTKEYQLGQLQSMKTTVLNQWRRLTGRPIEERAPFKALDDVNFSIEAGEVVGIIGHNGAGKSTILKLLANISKPSSGSITVKGKVAPLIEVGAGLVGDLTGRENIYLNGAILGISKAEITRKFDDIVAFAELEEFIDTPIKRYSSGMSVRLGFAIATSVESDILIVDEVLAVGDLAFQRKCFDRMEDLIKHQGKTVLLVSHNIRQVERICNRAILLSKGKVVADGKSMPVCNRFFEESDKKIQEQLILDRPKGVVQSHTSSDIELLEVQFLDPAGYPVKLVRHGEDLIVSLKYRTPKPIERLTFGLGIHTPDLLYLASKDTCATFRSSHVTKNIFELRCFIHSFPFLPGNYALRSSVAQGDAVIFYAENLHPFVVAAISGSRAVMSEEGFVPMKIDWSLL